ncbi:MAG TPA: hypothetical protein VIP05_15050 [Burkholderiaceae bacterium]
MANNREILLDDINPMALIDELAAGAVTDSHGLTLGDVSGHRIDRYLLSYAVLHLVGGMAHISLLSARDVLVPKGAKVQDKKGMDAFQAAHALPCDFAVNGRRGMHALFASPIIRGNVKARLFGRTNIVHRLVNYADRRCEANGWIAAFHLALENVLSGADPEQVFHQQLVTAYARAVQASRDRLEAALLAHERQVIATPTLYAPNGTPARPRPQDFRVGATATDPRALAINKGAVLQVFEEYAQGPAGLAPDRLDRAKRQALDWVELERQWRAKTA